VKKLFYLTAMFALTACGGSLFQSHAPPQSVYILSAKAAPLGPEIPVDLAVLKPLVRTGLDSDVIAALYPDRRLDYFAGARWSGRLDDVVRDLALQTFRVRANLRNVHAETSAFGSGWKSTWRIFRPNMRPRRVRRAAARRRFTYISWRVSAVPRIGACSADSKRTSGNRRRTTA
jgi:hypothetical protein